MPVSSFYVILKFTGLIFSVLLVPSLWYPLVNQQKGTIRMELKDTLEKYVMQLKNSERTLENVASVCQKIIAKLYDTYFPGAETLRRGPNSPCPDSDIITIAWLLELIGKDSELAGYKLVKAQLGHLFPHLPERSRFNRRRRNLCSASETLRSVLVKMLPDDDIYIVDSFPIPLCDFKRVPTSTSPLKCADGNGSLATFGKCATKGLNTFFGFRCSLITTAYGLPVDFAVATASTDDREVLPLFCERGTYPVIIGDKGYISEKLEAELLEQYNVCLLPTRRTNQKEQYPKSFQKLHQKIRRRIETTISQLSNQFSIGRIRARTHWGFRTRLSNKFSGFTLGIFLNKCLGRKLMALKDVVYA